MHDIINFRQLPPLKALKGFESTARNLSLRVAAKELNLTHPAISHQIKILEEDLGVKLFERDGRNIILSEAGQLLYPYVRDALAGLIQGVEAVRRKTTTALPLRVQTYITLSIRWLARRLSAFRSQCPEIDIQLSTYSSSWDFDESNADVGLIYCDTVPEPNLHWVPLFDYRVFPVCSPELLKDFDHKLEAKELLDLPLLSVCTEVDHWEMWFQSLGIDIKIVDSHLMLDTAVSALEMALNGEGVVLVNGPFVDGDLDAGRLVKPVEHEAVFPGGWGAICHQDMREDPRVKSFIAWLLENVEQK